MDNPSVKIYEPQLVVGNVEVAGGYARISCIECCGSRMFLGTLEGLLIEYFITEDKNHVHFNRVRQVNLNKGQPIMNIRSASAFDSLIILTGGTLSIYDIQTLESKGANSIQGVNCVAVDESPMNNDPFVIEMCISRKKSIATTQVSEKGFTLVKEISLDAIASSIAIESGLVCAGLSSGRYIFVDMNSQRKSITELCTFDTKDVQPKVIHIGKEEFLVIGPGGLGVFVTSMGTSERPPIIWPDKVSQICIEGINVVGAGGSAVYVNSLHDPSTNNTISFPGVKCLAISEGKLYIATTRSLYRFKPISVEEQVEALINSDEIERAFGLVENTHLKSQEKQLLLRKVHRKAVFIRIYDSEYSLARQSIIQSEIDLRELVSLFPNILPSTSTFTRTLPPLHNFPDVTNMMKGDSDKVATLAHFLLEILSEDTSVLSSPDLCASLIKLAAKYDKSQLGSILRHSSQMNINCQDCIEWMTEHKMFDCIAFLYKSQGNLSKALDIWLELASGHVECQDFDKEQGTHLIIETLLGCSDETLVWTYYEKLSVIDSMEALKVFTKREPSPTFSPLQIAEKLHSNRHICMEYLRHCVYEKKLENDEVHTYLATLYIEELTSSTNSSIEETRTKFRQFLIDSGFLKIQFLIGRLHNTKLRLELAILHGKAGDHLPALRVFVREIEDHELARDYCRKLRDANQRKTAYLDLLQIYFEDEKRPSSISPHCLDVLSDFGEQFDLNSVLHLLPDELSIAMISNLLRRAVRQQIHKHRQLSLVKGMAQRVNADYNLEMEIRNQGYLLEEESICGVCSRKLDVMEPVYYNKGLVVHPKCV